jgi:peptide/nickel transport system substrate-binding protein
MKHPMMFGRINARPSADILFTQLFKSDAPWNEANWKSEKFDQLLIAARGERDEGKRKQLYGDMQVLVHEEGGLGIPMFQSWLDAYTSKLKGMGTIPLAGLMGFMFAENVWLEG